MLALSSVRRSVSRRCVHATDLSVFAGAPWVHSPLLAGRILNLLDAEALPRTVSNALTSITVITLCHADVPLLPVHARAIELVP